MRNLNELSAIKEIWLPITTIYRYSAWGFASAVETRKPVKITTIGPLRVTGPDGEDLTPKGTGPKCLLALLVSPAGTQRSREWLHVRLWSDRIRASSSLRQALYELRNALGAFRKVIAEDRPMLWVDSSLVWIDRYDGNLATAISSNSTDLPELFHGLASGDAEFQSWIRQERAELERKLEPFRFRARQMAVSARPWLTILPPRFEAPLDAAFHANFIADAIACNIHEQGFADLVDAPRRGTGVGLRVEAIGGEGQGVLHVSFRDPQSDRMLWSASHPLKTGATAVQIHAGLGPLINQASHIAAHQIGNLSEERGDQAAARSGIEAVTRMFHGDLDDLEVAKCLLEQGYEQTRRGIYLAWLAYRETFLLGEHLADRGTQRDRVQDLIARSLELEQHNSMVLALASYTACFVLGEYRPGLELAERSLSYNSHNPLGRIHLARALSYLGDHSRAYEEATRACQIAGPGPYRHVFDFIAGITGVMGGHRKDAISRLEMVRLMKPNFRAARRQLFALYGTEGRMDEARGEFHALKRLEPDFSLRKMREPGYPAQGLQVAGCLEFEEEEFG